MNYSNNNRPTNPVSLSNLKEGFEKMIDIYLESTPSINYNGKNAELEIRFNSTSKYTNYITKIHYDNVIKQLYQIGFDTPNKNGNHILRISNEYTDPKSGYTKISNIRAELVGLDLIQEYCKTNNIQKILDLPSSKMLNNDKIKFTRKMPALKNNQSEISENNQRIFPIDFKDFGFRVSYQTEEDFTPSSGIVRSIVTKWTDTKKLFRLLNRVRYSHPIYPIFVDISIVKSSKKTERVPIPTYTLEESGVFTNSETYEIELEIDNSKVGIGTQYDTSAKLMVILRKMIRHIMGAFQHTNYPISFSEMEEVQQSYLKLIQGNNNDSKGDNNKGNTQVSSSSRRVYPKDFIGPSSYTLQLSNIIDNTNKDVQIRENTVMKIPNIRENMTVTDKADGERRMLFIHPNRKIYMIDTNMGIIFTGYVINNNKNTTKNFISKMTNSLIDGEFIKYNKNGEVINIFAGFDIYFIDGESVRELAFTRQPTDEQTSTKNRLQLLNYFISNIFLIPVDVADTDPTIPNVMWKNNQISGLEKSAACNLRIQCKTFYMTTSDTSIFQACNEILSKIRDGLFEYNTDGIIFTPSNTGVGSSAIGVSGPLHKITWENSFKWKPPQFNTIDFLVTVKKDKKGNDEIHNILQEGSILQQYKTLILMCGFDIKKHSNINPYMDIINDRILTYSDLDNTDNYIPVPFQPSDPFDSTAYICNIILQNIGGNSINEINNKNIVMRTEEGEYFEEDMIVEFRYDITKNNLWRWIPLRVRYDKTSELRAGIKNYGNAFHVANSNWTSIHNPITEEMITTGNGIPHTISSITEDDIYYNTVNVNNRGSSNLTNASPSLTRSMRDFHNLFVKTRLITSCCQRDDILIDYACGKGGDIPKWIQSKLGFIFGIDISRDNIHNRLNGACARYINYRKTYKNCPSCLFVQGNSASNIRTSEQAFITEKDKEITRAIFGKGPKDETLLGSGVYKRYGIAKDGFNVSSVQFALHYFFENKVSLNQFCRNLAECTRLGGYFIGTCYDGETVFQKLKKLSQGEELNIYKKDTVILKIIKQYSQTGFPSNENSLNYAIDIFQESINKTIREYLMNYKYLIRMMENYGFVELDIDEARKMGLPSGTGLFGELYQDMENEVRNNKNKNPDYKSALDMTPEEKEISFMNRYFIFKKVRNVDAEKMAKTLLKSEEMDESEEILNNKEENIQFKKNRARKLKVRKIVIEKYEPINDNLSISNDKPIQPILEDKITEIYTTNSIPPFIPSTPPKPTYNKQNKKKLIIIK